MLKVFLVASRRLLNNLEITGTYHFVTSLVPMQLLMIRVISFLSLILTSTLTTSLKISRRSSSAWRKAPIITVGCICCSRKGAATDSISPATTITHWKAQNELVHPQNSFIGFYKNTVGNSIIILQIIIGWRTNTKKHQMVASVSKHLSLIFRTRPNHSKGLNDRYLGNKN